MSDRPIGMTLLAVFLGLYALVAGGLVLWSIAILHNRPPIGFLALDLLVIVASAAASAGAWRRASWSRRALGVLAGALIAVLWAHVFWGGTGMTTGSMAVGVGGTSLLLAAAWLGARVLTDGATKAP